MIAEVLGCEGKLVFDATKPDGTMRKLMDISKIRELGWSPKTDLSTGIALAYQDMLAKV